jgi:hypothetical protein
MGFSSSDTTYTMAHFTKAIIIWMEFRNFGAILAKPLYDQGLF